MRPTSDTAERVATADVVAWAVGGIGDIPAVAALSAASFEPHFRESWSAAQMAVVVAGAGGLLQVARAGAVGRPLAFALSRFAADEVELLLCAIDPGWRRRGLGRAALQAVVDEAGARGARRLFLEVRESNAAARALYHACGLSEAGRRSGYYRTVTGDGLDAITLVKKLC